MCLAQTFIYLDEELNLTGLAAERFHYMPFGPCMPFVPQPLRLQARTLRGLKTLPGPPGLPVSSSLWLKKIRKEQVQFDLEGSNWTSELNSQDQFEPQRQCLAECRDSIAACRRLATHTVKFKLGSFKNGARGKHQRVNFQSAEVSLSPALECTKHRKTHLSLQCSSVQCSRIRLGAKNLKPERTSTRCTTQ